MSAFRRRIGIVGWLAAATMSLSCRENPVPFQLFDGTQISAEQLSLGREVYLRNCYACHGEQGAGDGPSAATMRPPPRNLQHGLFKFAGVAAGSLPTDAALDRTLRRGLDGTPMLAWDLAASERQAVIQYLKTFKLPGSAKSRWQEESPGAAIEPSPDPWGGRAAEAVAAGAAIYHVQGSGHAGCASCHAGYLPYAEVNALTLRATGQPVPGFRPDYYRTSLRETQYAVRLDPAGELLQGHQILVPDFWIQPVKTAPSPTPDYTASMQRESLYRTIAGGIGGAAMPTWKGALSEDRLWALVYYVQRLSLQRGTTEAAVLRRELDAQPVWSPEKGDKDER